VREVNQKNNWADEERLEPFKETSTRFKSGGMGKLPKLVENIHWAGEKNQMKLDCGRSLYHQEPPPCDLSGGITRQPFFKESSKFLSHQIIMGMPDQIMATTVGSILLLIPA